MAFSFALSQYTDYSSEVLGLLGFKSNDPFIGYTIVEDNTATRRVVERFVNKILTDNAIDFDGADAEDQTIVYDAALYILAGNICKNYLPMAIPKYMSDNKAVFDRFRAFDFLANGQRLIDEGLGLLEEVTGVASADLPMIVVNSPTTDLITGSDYDTDEF
jgi:hypothetical protein